MATNVNETERLKELLREWLAECGVHQSPIHSYATGGHYWVCARCKRYSDEGPDKVAHAPGCLAERTERALAEGEGDKEARDGESSGGTAGTATDV